jgi:hypothetical protein
MTDELPPSPPIIDGLTAWFRASNPGAQPLYSNAGKLQTPVYWQYLGTPAAHTPALDAELATLKAYVDADEAYAMNSNSGHTSFGNDGPVFATPTTSLVEPLKAAAPAERAAVIAIAQTAVTLPSDHRAHTWLLGLIQGIFHAAEPIIDQVIVSEATALASRIPGAMP